MGKYRELAAAIRKGAKMRPQGFGGMVKQIEAGTSCAMLAACEVVFGYPKNYEEVIRKAWSICRYFEVAGGIEMQLWKKNDLARMTREQIADWLDTLEPRISDTEFTARFISEVVESVKSQEVAEVK